MLSSYKDLRVWQMSLDLVEEVYRLTKRFPPEEIYALSVQMRRAAVSIPSNIAEGSRRKDLPEYLHFLRIADASSAELETQIVIAKRIYPTLQYEQVETLLQSVQKMLTVLLRTLSEKNPKPKTQNPKPRQGFTLAEVLVAIAIFSVVVSIAVGGFVRALRTERDIAALVGANSNVSLVIEQMAREIRTGYDFCGSFPNAGCPISGTVDTLVFTNAQSETVTYCRDSAGALVRGVGTASCGGSGFEELTADTVFVGYLHFVLLGNRANDGRTPRITISLGVAPRAAGVSEDFVNVQTTVSARTLDS